MKNVTWTSIGSDLFCRLTTWAGLLQLSGLSRSVLGIVAFGFGLLLLSAQCQGEAIINITFDGPPIYPPGSRYSRTNYGELGTYFEGDCGRSFPPSQTAWPSNETVYIVPTGEMRCRRPDDLRFGLISADLASYSHHFPSYIASFNGYRADGSVVTTNISVSGLTFQTFHFSPGFTELTNLTISAGALDNLKLQLPTVQPELKIGTSSYRTDSWIRLEAYGTAGLNYRLEYADHYPTTNWSTLAEFQSMYFLTEHVSTNMPLKRFFRVVGLP